MLNQVPFERLTGAASLPPAFDASTYRQLHPDLQSMSDIDLISHYNRWGRAEGRRSHPLPDRAAFAALIPCHVDALEIGPFHWPLLEGPHVRYFDVLDRNGLIERAKEIGIQTSRVPREIHFVSPNGDLGIVTDLFDAVLSSHVIEHQPDLIGHLRQVEALLRPGGCYFVLIPDKNYCFDHFMAESTIAQIIDTHHTGRRLHNLQSQIEHVALTTHNEPERHWRGDHGAVRLSVERIRECVRAFLSHPDLYVDVHAWYFTPDSFCRNLKLLRELSYTNFSVSRVYPTMLNANEFWAVLSLPPTY